MRIVVGSLMALLAAVAPASAQTKAEVSGFFGWTLADGVSGDPVLGGDGNIYDRVDPADSESFGFSLATVFGQHVEVGFLWDRQSTTLEIGGTTTRDMGELDITNMHGYVGYNFGSTDSPVRPYVLGGLGATSYSNVAFTTAGGAALETGGNTQFSTTWGAGVKLFPSAGAFGIRAGVRWTPTFIKSDADGWWCDPYWGCYVVGDTQVREPARVPRRHHASVLGLSTRRPTQITASGRHTMVLAGRVFPHRHDRIGACA